jgi:MbtH protein
MSFRVVANLDRQYSVWPMDKAVPDGWVATGFEGPQEECLAHIDRVWTDLRPARPLIRQDLAALIEKVSDGQLAAAEILAADDSFVALGLSSLALVRLIDAVEAEFGVEMGPGSEAALGDLAQLTTYIATQQLSQASTSSYPAAEAG